MIEVGLSGGIGSGKTSVSNVFKNLDIPVYNADTEAKHIMNSDTKTISHIQEIVGSKAYKNGQLQKEYIASQIFSNPEIRVELEKYIHKKVRTNYTHWVSQQTAPFVLQENALMFARDSYTLFDETIYVYCPETIRIQRVAKRDNLSPEKISQRISAQASDNECMHKAGFIIYNDNTQLIIPQINSIYATIKNNIHG
ncbi:MAG: dephospho-CoA kinase [Bacteroidales bacterium]